MFSYSQPAQAIQCFQSDSGKSAFGQSSWAVSIVACTSTVFFLPSNWTAALPCHIACSETVALPCRIACSETAALPCHIVCPLVCLVMLHKGCAEIFLSMYNDCSVVWCWSVVFRRALLLLLLGQSSSSNMCKLTLPCPGPDMVLFSNEESCIDVSSATNHFTLHLASTGVNVRCTICDRADVGCFLCICLFLVFAGGTALQSFCTVPVSTAQVSTCGHWAVYWLSYFCV